MEYMSEKNIILTARIVSLLFTPFYLPLIGVLALLFFSYLSLFPWQVKVVILALIYLSTLLLPTFLIHLYRKYQGWTPLQMGLKERRMVPYIISILCYFGCYYVVNICHMPHPISSILVVAVLIQVLCAIINVWWKISTHTTGLGGVAGSLLAYADQPIVFSSPRMLSFRHFLLPATARHLAQNGRRCGKVVGNEGDSSFFSVILPLRYSTAFVRA